MIILLLLLTSTTMMATTAIVMVLSLLMMMVMMIAATPAATTKQQTVEMIITLSVPGFSESPRMLTYTLSRNEKIAKSHNDTVFQTQFQKCGMVICFK